MPPAFPEMDALYRAIEAGDNAAIGAILEGRVESGDAPESEALLYAVSLLFPPFADCATATEVLRRLFNGTRAFEAAVWDAYRFATLSPDGEPSFLPILQLNPASAIATHMICLVESARGNYDMALQANRRSRALRLFPFNIVHAIKLDADLGNADRKDLLRTLRDLVRSRSAETDKAAGSVEGLLQGYWDNLIVGTRITSELWAQYAKTFRDLGS